MIDWHPIRGVFLPHAQDSQDRLGIQDVAPTGLVVHHAMQHSLSKILKSCYKQISGNC